MRGSRGTWGGLRRAIGLVAWCAGGWWNAKVYSTLRGDVVFGYAGTAMSDPAPIDPRLLEVLVCPVTRGPLRWDAAAQELVSVQARLAYPVRDGIPIMLPEEARVLDE